jgi:hypothetical protein
MLIVGDFLNAKVKFIFVFSPLFPTLITFRAATISLIHPQKFLFFSFKKSPKISISSKTFETLLNRNGGHFRMGGAYLNFNNFLLIEIIN